ncbi:MAG: 2'-5' RNA ligase family protein [Pelagimonas sp.]|jgi:2'-5' RNA ligase|nr:2'-5' RNA ligase family protein [Pelagimonas sp.]
MTTETAGYSIWLVPQEPQLTRLSTCVRDFARKNGTPSFVPHVTLLGDIAGKEAALAEIMARFSGRFAPYDLMVTEVETGDSYYKSLYLNLESPAALQDLQTALCNDLPVSQVPREFQPHISLAYGDLSPEVQTAEAEAFVGSLMRFEVMHLVRSSQTVPIEDWAIVKSFAL